MDIKDFKVKLPTGSKAKYQMIKKEAITMVDVVIDSEPFIMHGYDDIVVKLKGRRGCVSIERVYLTL